MAAIDYSAIARQSSAEFADALGRNVRGSFETEFTTEDDFVAESAASDVEDMAEFMSEPIPEGPEPPVLDIDPKVNPILAVHW